MKCALKTCCERAEVVVAHPFRPEGATPLCERHGQFVERELAAERI